MIKLPDNPADRKKVIAALCIGGLGFVYLVFTFGIQPYLAGMQTRRARVVELEDSIWRAQNDLNSVDRNLEQNAQVVKDLLSASESLRYILRPSLGNYLLVATEIINTAAAGLHLSIDNVSEVPRPPAPPAKSKETPASSKDKETPPSAAARFAPYTVNVSLTGGLHPLIQFLNRLESANPYIILPRMVIMEQSEIDPERHFVSLHIQWPTWVDDDHPRRLEAELIADEDRQ